MSRRIAVALSVALAGCLEFREITPPPPLDPVPAEFRAAIEFHAPFPGQGEIRTGAPDSVRIHAVLTPGLDAAGAARLIHDDTLRIDGVAFPPSRVEAAGARVYEGWARLPPAAQQGVLLAISPPALARGGKRPPMLYQAVPVRVGDGMLEVARGADLSLAHSLAAPPAGAEAFSQQWSLEVTGDRAHVNMSGWGLPPAPLVIPAAMVRTIASERIGAQLSVHSRTRVGDRWREGYSIEVSLTAWLGWSVRLVKGP